ncbi:MAG: N-acetyltransferase [Pseudomonadota bacterium]
MILTLPTQPFFGLARLMELRIDVPQAPPWLGGGFDALHERLHTPGDRLYGLPRIPMADPKFQIRWREADGEFYLYVEDLSRKCLAGYTVFNRMVELGRRADRCIRAPHSKYQLQYQRRGLASAVYKWALDKGFCLMTGARQSPGANALWHALARRHQLGYVELRDKAITYLGREVSQVVLDSLHTRMLLLGKDWTVGRLSEATGMS